MKARALFREGKLDEAIASLNVELRQNPTDVQRRTFLFELLCFAGAYDRAEKQLNVLAQGGPEAAMGALVYQSALHGERTRQEMFDTGDYPAGGSELRPVSGTLNGEAFESLEDADPRIGSRLELFAAGQYTWIPLEQIVSVSMAAPARLRDLMWAPAAVRTTADFQGSELGEVLVPVLSPLSWQHPNDLVRLGRVTEWTALDGDGEAPVGQKMLLVDGEEFPVLEVRELVIEPASASGG